LNGVKNGKWKALVERTDEDPLWGSRIKELITHHESYGIEHLSYAEVEECGFTVGVDSGQAGIFDFNTYRNDQIAEGFARTKEPGDAWYDMCCKRTLSDHQCGTVFGDVVTCAGYGDGLYKAWYVRNDRHEIVAMGIVFIDKYENEDEDI